MFPPFFSHGVIFTATFFIFLPVGMEIPWLVWWSEATSKEWVYSNKLWFDATWRGCKYNKCNYSFISIAVLKYLDRKL